MSDDMRGSPRVLKIQRASTTRGGGGSVCCLPCQIEEIEKDTIKTNQSEIETRPPSPNLALFNRQPPWECTDQERLVVLVGLEPDGFGAASWSPPSSFPRWRRDVSPLRVSSFPVLEEPCITSSLPSTAARITASRRATRLDQARCRSSSCTRSASAVPNPSPLCVFASPG